MIRRLIILLLIVGCATKPIKPIMIIDGTINTGSTTVISVTGFRNNTSNSEVDWIGESIADNITSDLVRISSLNIVNRKDLKKILQEQKFQHSGLVDLEKSVEIGEMAGATKLIAGDYSVVNGELRINVNYLDVESGITEKSISKSGKLKDLSYIQYLLVLDLLKALNIDASELEEMKISQLKTEYFDAIENNYKGVLAVDNQKIKEAIEYFEKAVLIDPRYKKADNNLLTAKKIKFEGKGEIQKVLAKQQIFEKQSEALKEIFDNFLKSDFMRVEVVSYDIDNISTKRQTANLSVSLKIYPMQDAFDILNKHIQSIAVKSTLISGIIGTSSFPRIVPSGFLWDWNPEYVISGYQEYVIEQYKGFPNHPHYFKIYSSLSKYLIFKANEEVINKIEINTLWTDKYIFYEYQGLKVKHPYPVLTSQSLNINCQLSLANIEKITSIEIQNKENIAPLPPNKSSKFETGVIIVQAIVVVILTYVLFY